MTVAVDREASVYAAIASVDDPEYPGVSIVDLGLLESFAVSPDGAASINLIPTFSGCPALSIIADDVQAAVATVAGVGEIRVRWLRTPVWSPERLTDRAKVALASEFTVAVEIRSQPTSCPRCGSPTTETSMFGPSRCRSVHRCEACAETVEVMRA